MRASDLRKSILQAAVQGKLVPQNVHDEPAHKLLARIQKEKTQLVKSGKIKQQKPLPPIAADETPYDLPDGWVWCRLGEICNYGTCTNANPNEIPQSAWILELEDIEKESGRLSQTGVKRNPQSTKHRFKAGDVLYGKLRPYLNKVIVAPRDGFCTSEMLPLSFGEIVAEYAVICMRSPVFVDYATQCSYGVKMPRLGTQDGRAALFPLPPLAEQRRIVAKVDDLMALCGEVKSVICG